MKQEKRALLRLFAALCALPLCGALLPQVSGFWNTAGVQAAQSSMESGAVPEVSDVQAETYADVYVEVPLTATDPDGDVVMFQLTETPRLGTAVIEGNVLQYTPIEGKTGTDKFCYTAVDVKGNSAPPQQIQIKIRKNAAKRTYADMSQNRAHYAALRLSEAGILQGEKIGASYFLHPQQEVSRSEFIAMAATIANLPIEDTAQTDFIDDEGLSAWSKPYISAMASNGAISGYLNAAGSAEIRGQNPITLAEASVILDHLLSVQNRTQAAQTISIANDPSIPAWVAEASANLTAENILPSKLTEATGDVHLTRDTASQMLYQTMCLMQ